MDNEDESCQPDNFRQFGFIDLCQYVRNHSDECEGGGYLLWTEMKVCTNSGFVEVLIVVAALLFFILLFLHLSITADSFFCKNIASIVDLHKISQNIAGITFMAFGNGAPDIFSSIASVISVKQPRADLAISELLGGGIFVTTCVIGCIAFNKPFSLMRRPILRDIFFYLIALFLLVIVANMEGQMVLWQSLAFLLLYLIYAMVVIFGNLFQQRRMANAKRRPNKASRVDRAIARFVPKKIVPVAAIETMKSAYGNMPKEDNKSAELILTPSTTIQRGEDGMAMQQHEGTNGILQLPGGILIIPIREEGEQMEEDDTFCALDCLEAGKFFGKEEIDAEMDTTEAEEEGDGAISALSKSVSSVPISQISALFGEGSAANEEMRRFCCHLNPLDLRKFRRAKWPEKLYRIAKIPSLVLLKLTVPCASQSWSKPMAVIHAFLFPLIFCFAFKLALIQLSSLQAWELALILSAVFSLLVILFTSFRREPACYKWIASYLGFVLSIAWIYATASEVLNVVLMFGNLFHISYQILGLTAISWCNSIGDLIADVSVARQGMPRMAFSAAIGAPLFNLMVGFGSTFTIAKIQGKEIIIQAGLMSNVMFAFLCLSLLSTLTLLIVQKFFVRKFYGLILFALYLIFIVCAILANMGIF